MDFLQQNFWALLAAFALDLLIGDPEGFPHPVRLIGRFIAFFEGLLRRQMKRLRIAAVWLTAVTVLLSMGVTALLLGLLYGLHPYAYAGGMAILSWTCLSMRNLADEAKGVAAALKVSVPAGRTQVARIVGRDTASLCESEIITATVETVAENTTDGVISPMLYLLLGGPVLAMGFKAASTLDSMVGYWDDKYRDIGWSSAKLDDVLNFLPARLTALLMCAAACLVGLNGPNAWRIMRRDHANHLSPNCAFSESAAAGALGIRLGGTHDYFGQSIVKPTIGDDDAPPTTAHIDGTIRLLYGAGGLMLALSALVVWII